MNTWTEIYGAHVSPESSLAKLVAPLKEGQAPVVEKPTAQYKWMQIFENKGAAMGCSNPHPHGQIWTTTGLPEEPALELAQLQKYRVGHPGGSLLGDYAKLEIEKGERVVFSNTGFVVICPWWATWPFEVMIIAREHRRSLVDFTEAEKEDFAEAIAEVTRRYDNLFETSFPYSKSNSVHFKHSIFFSGRQHTCASGIETLERFWRFLPDFHFRRLETHFVSLYGAMSDMEIGFSHKGQKNRTFQAARDPNPYAQAHKKLFFSSED